MRLVEIKEPGVEDRICGNVGMTGLDDLCIRVEAADDLARRIDLRRGGIGDLVEDHHIGELDLFGQQVDEAAVIALARGLPPVAQEIMAGIVLEQVHRIDHRDHGVEAGDIGQAGARFVAKGKCGGNRQRLGDAGRFDQQIIEPPLGGEAAHLGQKIVAQGAADAAIGHFHQRLVGAGKLGVGAHQIGVDIDLGHVVDDHRDALAVAVVQHAVEERGLARAQKARQHRDGQAGVGGLRFGHGGAPSSVRQWMIVTAQRYSITYQRRPAEICPGAPPAAGQCG
jgi:hypothetical protein